MDGIKRWPIWHPKATTFYTTYSSFKQVTRMFIRTALIVGSIALVMFSLLDFTDWQWWHQRSYIPNIAAGLTGFLIGAPVGLVVLATFQTEREQKVALDRVNALSRLAWDKFRDSIYRLSTEQRIDTGLGKFAREAREHHDGLFAEYRRRIDLAQTRIPGEAQFRNITDDEILDFQAFLGAKAAEMSQSMRDVTKYVGNDYNLQVQWSVIRTNWNILTGVVRLQRLEQNLAWFSEIRDAEFMNQLSELSHPLTKFLQVHEEDASNSTASLKAALDTVRRDSRMTTAQLREKIMAGYTGYGSTPVNPHYMSEFGHGKYHGQGRVEGHEILAQECRQSLLLLKRTVNNVENDGWPGNATESKF